MDCYLRAPHEEHGVDLVDQQGNWVSFRCEGVPHRGPRSDAGDWLAWALVALPVCLVFWWLAGVLWP